MMRPGVLVPGPSFIASLRHRVRAMSASHALNPRFAGYGLGLRKEHYRDFLDTDVPVDFVDVR
jgi:hypothetical protein